MIDPPRLLDGELRPVEQALLRAAEDDAPSAASRAAAKAALGLEAPVPVAAASSSGGWTVVVGAGVVLAAALWVGVGMLSVEPAAPPPVEAPAPAPVVAVAPAPEPPAPSAPTFEPLAPSLFVGPPTAPAPVRVAKARPAPRRAKPAPAPAGGSIAEELRLLDRAREALGHGDSKVALRTLHTYRARFPSGALAPEAEVLTVRVYTEVGRLASARRALRRLRALSPDHPALPELMRGLEGR